MNTTYRTKTFVSGMILSLALSSSIVYGTGVEAQPNNGSLHNQFRSAARQRIHGLQQYWQQHSEHTDQKPFPIVEESATVLGIKSDSITQKLQQGKSIAIIAKEQGQEASSLIDKLLTLRVHNIDNALLRGKLTSQQAERMKMQMKQHLTFMVYNQGLANSDLNDPNRMLHRERMVQPRFEKLAEIIGMSPKDFTSQLTAGKSISEIALSKGITKEMLHAQINDQMKPQP
jgi:hypothetical protein